MDRPTRHSTELLQPSWGKPSCYGLPIFHQNPSIPSKTSLASSLTVSPRHRSKRCTFHDTYDHTTEECIVLSDQLEDLIRAGRLNKYIHHQRERGRRKSHDPRQRSQTPPKPNPDRREDSWACHPENKP
ncbi:hypothetical protein Cni_G09245 [Canna indica]|uniref:Uncharacterized protein n=1 Tax=Canna indica TaxID=4628 RepID=A0AAQ3K257_9LILI|nr:hypothetical protein Cni_G09245 [Canna indica]